MEKHYTITVNINFLRHTVVKTIYDILSILIEKHGDDNEVQRYLRNDGEK
jgi:hypothetical protein